MIRDRNMRSIKKDVAAGTVGAGAVPMAGRLIHAARMDVDEVIREYGASLKGLDQATVEERRDEYGPNIVERDKPLSWHKQLFDAFASPFSAILGVLVVISLFTDVILVANPADREWAGIVVIAAMVAMSGILKFVQEGRSAKAAEKLREMVRTTAAVIRPDSEGGETELWEIVPGDMVRLSAGDMVPADVRIVRAKDLFVSQSALTGESDPVEKYSELNRHAGDKAPGSLLDLEDLCFLGADVVSGSALAVVIATGKNTFFGSMASAISGRRPDTAFDKGINAVSRVLIRFMLIMVPVVFLINGLTKGNWIEAMLFGISIAVGLTPEMLPMIVTTGLARGAVAMARRKTVIKHLSSIQNFGAMDVLCTDKTGTLTQNKIILERHLDIHGKEDDRVLRHAYLNSYYQTGLKNLLDVAVLERGNEKGLAFLGTLYEKVDEIPFDFSRRRMSVVLRDASSKTQMVTKGAVEEMLSISSHAEYQGEVIALTPSIRSEILNTVEQLNADGMRVVAVAQKNNPTPVRAFSVLDESNMVLMGYVAFLDPPKETAAAAISALRDYGVTVKVITGDNEVIAGHVCNKVGLPVKNMLLGSTVDSMDDAQLAEAAERTTLFAKLSPLQKARVVNALKMAGHTVGFMGDGINDAAAMREADVGISVDTAVDIAKESADIILLEKDLMVLERGIIEGRKVFGNITKYIKMTTSSSFGNMFSVLAASVFLPFLPMIAIQILALNLIYDICCISIPWDNVDPEYLMKPRKWDASSIVRFMTWMGPTSSVFDIATYVLMFTVICPRVVGPYVFNPSSAAGGTAHAIANNARFMALFNAGWFVESLASQTLVIHMIRTPKIPFIQSRASWPVLMMTAAAIAVGARLPYTILGQEGLKMYPLPGAYYPWLAAMILGYMALATFVKGAYRRRYGELS